MRRRRDSISIACIRASGTDKPARVACFLKRGPATPQDPSPHLAYVLQVKGEDIVRVDSCWRSSGKKKWLTACLCFVLRQLKQLNVAFDDMAQGNLRNVGRLT